MATEKIKNKVREIQHKYCGESVETKMYYAIEEEIQEITRDIIKIIEKRKDKSDIGTLTRIYSYCKKQLNKDELDNKREL